MESGSTGGGSFCRGNHPPTFFSVNVVYFIIHFLMYLLKRKENPHLYIYRSSDCELTATWYTGSVAHWCFSTFVKQADPVVVLNDNNAVVVTSNRLQEGSVPPLEQGMVVGQLVLADSLIIGNCNNQVLTH